MESDLGKRGTKDGHNTERNRSVERGQKHGCGSHRIRIMRGMALEVLIEAGGL